MTNGSFYVASDVVPSVYNKLYRLSFSEIIQIWNTWESVSQSICKHLEAREIKNCKKWTSAYKNTEDEEVFFGFLWILTLAMFIPTIMG